MKLLRLIPILLFALAITLAGSFSSCQKEITSSKQQQVAVYLSDDPVRFDTVNIDIRMVEVKVDTADDHHQHDDHFDDMDDDHDDSLRHHDDFGTWINLNFTPGIYNIAQLRNGIETLLASGNINGTVRKLRLTLGTNNTVVVGGVSYPLHLVNTTGHLVYVHIKEKDRDDNNGTTAIRIDFDLGRSIRLINGNYYLIPVLKPFCNRNFAELEGKVLPEAAHAMVSVFNATDTAIALPNDDGYFKVRGLPSGTYSVFFDGTSPYMDTTINNITVTAGQETRLPAVTLHQ